ncbi:hypothetical protein KCP76_20790 [Salmonella enterica subsp. enterica serovar Weltevreden]|nr:hypothetical protein KCP76_20790 [Salmonella enterica subsp. enterica serovar Weltevreden]
MRVLAFIDAHRHYRSINRKYKDLAQELAEQVLLLKYLLLRRSAKDGSGPLHSVCHAHQHSEARSVL